MVDVLSTGVLLLLLLLRGPWWLVISGRADVRGWLPWTSVPLSSGSGDSQSSLLLCSSPGPNYTHF